MQGALFKLTKTIVNTIAPWILVLATITAIISPVIMLRLRGIDKGFTAAITALLLPLDILLISPLFALHWGSPEKTYVESRRTRAVDKKSKKNARSSRRNNDVDLESFGLEGSTGGNSN